MLIYLCRSGYIVSRQSLFSSSPDHGNVGIDDLVKSQVAMARCRFGICREPPQVDLILRRQITAIGGQPPQHPIQRRVVFLIMVYYSQPFVFDVLEFVVREMVGLFAATVFTMPWRHRDTDRQ